MFVELIANCIRVVINQNKPAYNARLFNVCTFKTELYEYLYILLHALIQGSIVIFNESGIDITLSLFRKIVTTIVNTDVSSQKTFFKILCTSI